VIGGLVMMFSFLNSTMAAATQRFLSYEIGLGDPIRIRKVFSTIVSIHILLSIIVFILIESVGVYFLNTKINLGDVNKFTAQCILHFTALSLVLTINSVPYNSLLISKENMSHFAYIDIAGEVMKLFVGFSLALFTSNKLIYYAILMFMVAFTIRVTYIIVCHRKYPENRYMAIWDKDLIKQIATFSGWTTVSALSFMVRTQGVSLILNVFLGPFLNAAVGLSTQINSAVKTFSQNFQMSFVPQIIKTYAQQEYGVMNHFIFSGAKLSTYLLMILAGPVMLNISYLLNLWLIKVPPYTAPIVILVLVESIIQVMTCTGNVAIRATGRIMWYEMLYSGIGLLALPVMILMLYKFTFYYIPFLIVIAFTIISSFVKLLFLKKEIQNFDIANYIINIFIKSTLFMVCSITIPIIVTHCINNSFWKLVLSSVLYESILFFCIIMIGLNIKEKLLIKSLTRKIMSKWN
jgi:O-antigen/teichoic acid export membrane protein